MGAWSMRLMLHDTEVEDFVRTTLDVQWADMDPDELRIFQHSARYVAERIHEACPGLLNHAREFPT